MDHGEIAEAQSSTSAVGATQNAAVTIINRHLNIGPFQLTRDGNIGPFQLGEMEAEYRATIQIFRY
jgi:hypothetical protein